ncbi:thymidine phosphorylase [Occallatibacter savannae]|uniref:thymidine phosphorylase n=1 Tax=Occallatibacter savannae TaxID=1002691 RepID=UPI00195173CE|nr:thymidine phosphorylase [Occallatibacter savannae]
MPEREDAGSAASLHMVDLIRKMRDGGGLDEREIGFIVEGAANESIPIEQLSAWLMAAWMNGLSIAETRALAIAMRDSGEKLDSSHLGRPAVDKHSTGGVGDKTSFLVAPLAAACGVAVPMISGRALGHTGGTLDKLDSIPGFRSALSLPEFETVVKQCGVAIVSQTPTLVPADRVLYALRDRTGTVEDPGLICASILSKKLAAGLRGLVLDVKTGSGAFLRKREDAEFLAALMVATAESAGTHTVALMTDMSQPLGRTAGNWIEIAECVELLQGEAGGSNADLRELSLQLAGWMIHLGGKTETAEQGYEAAAAALANGSGLRVFKEMVRAQGGDVTVFEDLQSSHRPGARLELKAWKTGYVSQMDTMELGWAVQRLGAGRLRAGEPVDPHAGVEFHARRGVHVEAGQPFATLFASDETMLAEPSERIKRAVTISDEAPEEVPLVSLIFTRENAERYLRDAVR